MDSQQATGNFIVPGLLACVADLDLPKSDFDLKTEDWSTILGPEDWSAIDTSVAPPPPKKSKLSLSLQKKTAALRDVGNHSRFASPVKEKESNEAAKGVVPTNTKQCNEWAFRAFSLWATQRNEKPGGDSIPSKLLECKDPQLIAKYMRYFVLEARREDGEHYHPGTIRSLLCGLNRILKENGATFTMMDKGNPAFRELLLTLDTVTSSLHRQGIGATRKSALVISSEHEKIFWDKGLLGYDHRKTLQRAVFFYIGLNFVLRGVDEQHSLMLDQVVRYPSSVEVYSGDVYYEYTEFISKNNQHRFKDINSKNKSVRVFATPGSGQCVVRLLDIYISKLPESPRAFYLRPLSSVPSSGPWYGQARVGVNTLKKIVAELCKEAGLDVHYTNHSLRATAVTRMYEGGVPENIISEKSGHKSIKGVRAYEKTSIFQEKTAGASINAGKPFNTASEDCSATYTTCCCLGEI